MPEWLKICLVAVFLLWVVWEAIQFFRFSSERWIKRRILILCEKGDIKEYVESYWLGARSLKIVFGPSSVRTGSVQTGVRLAGGVKPVSADASPETHEQAAARLLREMLVLSIPRWPKSAFSMPKYIELTVLGKHEVYELVPLKATVAGKWYFTYEERPAEAGAKSKSTVKVPLGFWSYIIQKQRIGTVVSKTSLLGKKKVVHVSPRSGFIVSMQVQNGMDVAVGDVVCILACQTELTLHAAEIESASPAKEAS